MKKWEMAMVAGLLASLLYCALPISSNAADTGVHWWGSAFAPLCRTLLTEDVVAVDGAEEEITVQYRSKIAELIQSIFM